MAVVPPPTHRLASERAAAARRLLTVLAILLSTALIGAACGSDGDSEAEATSDPAGAQSDTGSDEADDESDGAAESDQAMEDDDQAADGDNGQDGDAMEPDGDGGTYPIDVETAGGTVTITSRPERIISLSPTATEMLFAIGAGDRVTAVDLNSNYPPEAPEGSLDGFVPDLEAILAAEPDVVVASGLPDDVLAGLVDGGVATMILPAAESFDDTYDQIAQLGEATGQLDEAAAVNAEIRQGIDDVIDSLPESTEPIRVFHEIDDSFYTATSGTFIGQVYESMGFQNIADPLDDGTGFPQVDGESIIDADPSLIVFTSQATYTREDIEARPGWDGVTAVAQGNIAEVEADIASRWGPRIVEFMEAIAAVILVDA